MKAKDWRGLAYGGSWFFILAFFAWTVNLLLNVQKDWAQSNEITRIDQDVHAMFNPWRNLNRPGNDVLENYEVAVQQRALELYLQEYASARAALDAHENTELAVDQFRVGMDEGAIEAEKLARRVLGLAGEREALRLSGATPGAIRVVETEAATTMARMDQAFQAGLDLIAGMDERADRRMLELDASRRASIGSLYIIVLVALLASALALVLLRRTMVQGEALRAGADRINAIVNNVVDGIITVDDNGDIESVNKTAEMMFGYDAAEIEGRPFAVLLDSPDRGRHEGGAPVRGEENCVGLRKDGSRFPMELATTRIRVEDRPLLVQIARDITERRQAEQRLQLAASVFENTAEGILITDRNANIQSTNPAFTAITGFTAEEVLGRNPRFLQSGRQSPDFYRELWRSVTETGHWQGEIHNRRKNGEIYPQWLNINAIKDADGVVTNYVGVTFDISEIKASERVKDEFIATVSHELRTPLTSIHGSLSLLSGGMAGELNDKAAELIRIAQENSQRLVRLIDDILSIAKIESERMKFRLRPVALEGLIAQAIEANQEFAKQYGVALRLRCRSTDARVLVDSDRLMQVMTNLLSNAVKHSPQGGIVRVTTEAAGEYWRVSVVDNGPGIPESFRDKIFGKFAQAEGQEQGKTGGTGLGLSICKAIIDRLGGRIGVESNPGVRTSFYFELPVMERRSIASLLSTRGATAVARKRRPE